MDDDRLEHFRALLIARRDELQGLSDTSAESRGTVELDQQSVGRLSRMDALQHQAMAAANERQRAAELSRIAAALDRLGRGDYGYCLSCGEDIVERRLEIDPSATLCVDCARSRDR
ncbi:TraR/DksA family transcriptional regulator [Rhodobium gokarnense]|uniref:DnaK suppressor protein n=1 Tax=Rhodobium gokarnense TaxID=364296 RepID=A0ABT3HFG5_9HYPH|nr:TraR/DksA family transcriptional regulator [Rhodobium gokarnense]MCW2309141.1 DnaK suppressor protein [Rhodobium gokarnense]